MASFLRLLDQDSVALEKHAWYAGELNVKEAKEQLDKNPVGEISKSMFCYKKPIPKTDKHKGDLVLDLFFNENSYSFRNLPYSSKGKWPICSIAQGV